MALIEFIGGMAVGFAAGVAASLIYLRWKMKRQLGNLEEQMSALQDIGDQFGEMDPEDLDEE